MGYKVAVVGATGNVGRALIEILAERNFPVSEVVALASARSVGQEISFGDDDILKVQDLAKYDFKGTDIVLSSPGASVSAEFSPKAAAAGAVVVDNTSHWRMDPDVPLVVPEVNPDAIVGYTKKGIIANPPRHRHLRPHFGRSHRLIAALAAKCIINPRSHDGFIQSGQVWRLHHHIQMQRSTAKHAHVAGP